jgi:spore cortex formation protein SpoVR/YcgB (stage V sporulation)
VYRELCVKDDLSIHYLLRYAALKTPEETVSNHQNLTSVRVLGLQMRQLLEAKCIENFATKHGFSIHFLLRYAALKTLVQTVNDTSDYSFINRFLAKFGKAS